MQNPSEKWCFSLCTSCYRCANKGMMAACNSCSGRHDPKLKRDPYDVDDYCDCKNGILRYRLQSGHFVLKKFHNNPFGGEMKREIETTDEREWNQFLTAAREKLDDENWDPIQFVDGSSTDKWLKNQRRG